MWSARSLWRNCLDKDNLTPEEATRLSSTAIEGPATADQPSDSQSGPAQDDQDEFHDASDGSEDKASSAPPSQSILRPPVIVPPPSVAETNQFDIDSDATQDDENNSSNNNV